jgi:hypothetical protein
VEVDQPGENKDQALDNRGHSRFVDFPDNIHQKVGIDFWFYFVEDLDHIVS